MDRKLKHLELIQGVINRLSTNSFLLKGWSVVLISALFALSAPNANIRFTLLAYLPALAFWLLDGFFLCQEQMYRKLYDEVRAKEPDQIDFSMDTSGITRNSWAGAVLSKTLIPFHGVLILAIVIVMLNQL